MEQWKDVVGYEGKYQVSNLGRVKGRKILSTFFSKGGYETITLGNKGTKKTCLVHRLVAEAFIPNPEEKKTVNHIDGNKKNNQVDNLEWVTRGENTKHAWNTGLIPEGHFKGENNIHAKLDEEDVIEIRKLYKPYSREWGSKQLAEWYGVTPKTIGRIIRRELWKEVI